MAKKPPAPVLTPDQRIEAQKLAEERAKIDVAEVSRAWLATYNEARPWATVIKEEGVTMRRVARAAGDRPPPGFAWLRESDGRAMLQQQGWNDAHAFTYLP